MRRRWLGWALVAPALVGCGSPSADLFSVQRTGVGKGARVALLVSDDGTVRCNGRAPVALGAKRLLVARELARRLGEPATLGLELEAGPAAETTFRYRARLEPGTIAFADSSRGIPPSFTGLAAFTRGVARGVCGLPR